MTKKISLKHAACLVSIAIVTLANVGAPQTSASTAPVPVAAQVEIAAQPEVATQPEVASYAEVELPPEPVIELVAEPQPTPRLLDEDFALERELRRYYASVRGARVAVAPTPSTAAVYVGPPMTGTTVVPILMYHHVAETGPGDDAIRRDLSVSPANFAAQMAYLARNGFVAISLAELNNHLEHSRPLPANAVALTFDDGYHDNFTAAFPALLRNGLTGTFFLITDFVGKGEYMTWAQARVMLAAGMSVESHSLDHPDLATLSGERLTRQLAQSRATLEKELGSGVFILSYPSGKYNASVMRAAQQAGYRAAVTTVYGDSHQAGRPFELTRVRIRGSDGLEAFAAKVRGPAPSTPLASQAK